MPFMLVKERGQDLKLNDPMNVFGSPWAVEFYTDIDPPGPVTGEVEYDAPVPMRPPPTAGGWGGPEACYRTSFRAAGSRWPGNYRHVYPILNLDGVLSRYAVHSTRMKYPYRWWDSANPKYTEFEEHYIDSLAIGTFENTVIGGPPWYTAHIYGTDVRPPGFFYSDDLYDLIWHARPNGQFAHHAGGGNSNRMMLRIAPKSYAVSDYDAASGKDRSVYVIDGRVYDYDQPVPLLLGDSKVSRELLAAQSIYGMNNPPVLDSTIDLYGDATLTGKIEGYLDLEGYDGYGYFSDFGIIKQSALE